jgi:hypothetical protein
VSFYGDSLTTSETNIRQRVEQAELLWETAGDVKGPDTTASGQRKFSKADIPVTLNMKYGAKSKRDFGRAPW